MQAGSISEYPRSESEGDSGVMDVIDIMEHGIVADAAVEDEIRDQLFCLDNFCPDTVPYQF